MKDIVQLAEDAGITFTSDDWFEETPYASDKLQRFAAAVRREALNEVWSAVNASIVTGPLQGDGWDQTAERNGLILAANIIKSLKSPSP